LEVSNWRNDIELGDDLMHKYHPLVFAGFVLLCLLGFVLASIASAFPASIAHVLNTIGGTLLVADAILVLVADWEGFTTLNGRITWRSISKNKRFWLGCLFCIFCPVPLVAYLIQVARYKPPASPVVPLEAHQ
jgi:hypothetical protein